MSSAHETAKPQGQSRSSPAYRSQAAAAGRARIARIVVMHDVRHHVEEQRIVVDRLGAGHRQADLPADAGGFAIEVVQHLDVVADEADRTEHRRLAVPPPRACRR